jgi:hypothetical protein
VVISGGKIHHTDREFAIVEQKTRRAQDFFSPSIDRAGFEPLRESGYRTERLKTGAM